MEHYWWCTEGDDCDCDDDVTEQEAAAAPFGIRVVEGLPENSVFVGDFRPSGKYAPETIREAAERLVRENRVKVIKIDGGDEWW